MLFDNVAERVAGNHFMNNSRAPVRAQPGSGEICGRHLFGLVQSQRQGLAQANLAERRAKAARCAFNGFAALPRACSVAGHPLRMGLPACLAG